MTAAALNHEKIEAPTREFRFGLVLYGGVSLAIYIYGVVYEFWRLVRASAERERNEYSELLERFGIRATVDIISGTSAGGINGVLLAKALATGAGMDVVRSLWVDEGDFLKLLRDAGEEEPRSFLRSERFDDLVLAGLNDMDRTGDGQPVAKVLDLFVPATRVRPWVRTFQDYSGLYIDTNDFRKVFNLKYRTKGFNPRAPELGYNRNDFAATQNELLAEVARATSAFPFAFEPRLIVKREPQDPRFARDEPGAVYFSDGGILHNKPFTEAIDTIYRRAAFVPVSRWLISVEPDPGSRGVQQAPGSQPEVVEVVGAALFGIPRAETIADDLVRLIEHRDRVARADELFGRLDQLVHDLLGSSPKDASAQKLLGKLAWRAYEGERFRAVEAELVHRFLDCAGLDEASRPYVESALRSLSDEHQTILAADLAFERRRIQHLLWIVDRATSALPAEAAVRVRASLWAAQERIEQRFWDTFGLGSTAAETLARLAEEAGAEITEAVARALPRVLEQLSTAQRDAEEEVEAAAAAFDAAFPPDAFPSGGPLPTVWRGLSFTFRNYELWDVFVVVVEHIGGVSERDPIKHRHITPGAATYIRKPVMDKLAGDSLGHFGGFLKKSWRNNDILWGRLDAAEIIVDTLFREHPPVSQAEREAAIRRVQEPIARGESEQLAERPQADYRLFLERNYTVGAEGLADVDVRDRAQLALQGTDVLRNMLRRLKNADYGAGTKGKGLRAAFGLGARVLGGLILILRWPTRAVWGRDVAIRRVLTLALFIAFVWAIGMLVLALLGLIPFGAFGGPLGLVAGAAVIAFLGYVILLALAARAARRLRRLRRN